MDLESKHPEKKASFDRVTVGLSVEQSNIEKECDLAQVGNKHVWMCLRVYLCAVSLFRLPRGILRRHWRSRGAAPVASLELPLQSIIATSRHFDIETMR